MLEDKARLILIMLMRPWEENANKVLIYTNIWLIVSWPYHCTAVARDLLIDSLQNMIIFREVVTETHHRIFLSFFLFSFLSFFSFFSSFFFLFFLSSSIFSPFLSVKNSSDIKVLNCELWHIQKTKQKLKKQYWKLKGILI